MNYKELQAEINKRDYENIEGLKAEITSQDYDYFLNVMPPLNWDTEQNTFLLNEALTGNLYLKFSREDNKFYCEVVSYNMNKEELLYYG